MANRAFSQDDLLLLGYATSSQMEQNPYYHVYQAGAEAGLTRVVGRFIYLTTSFATTTPGPSLGSSIRRTQHSLFYLRAWSRDFRR